MRQLPVVQLHDVRAAFEGALETRRGEVDEHRSAVAAHVRHQARVHLQRQRIGGKGIADHQGAGLEGRRAGAGDQLVDLVAGRRGTERLGDEPALFAAMVLHVAAAVAGGLHQPRLRWQAIEQRTKHGARFAAEQGAEHGLAPQLARHPGHPHPLAGGVQVDVVPTGAAILDRDREQRVGSKDGDALHAHDGMAVVARRCPSAVLNPDDGERVA